MAGLSQTFKEIASATASIDDAATDAPGASERWLRESFRALGMESLIALLPITLFCVWAWAVAVILIHDHAVVYAYSAIAVFTLAAALSYRWRIDRTTLAITIYAGGLIATLLLISLAFPGLATLCLFAIAVVILASLSNTRMLLPGTLACLTAIAVSAALTEATLRDAVVSSLLVIFTALSAWLGSRRLFTALQWAFSMTAESQRNAAEARWHRGEVQRVLKNLDEAYVRLEHVNQALVLAKDAAEKALRFKSDFVVNVSHELRTPLNLIIGFSEMMATAPESYGGVPLPKEYRGDVIATYRSAKHLSDLINDVLDLSQIEAGRMPISKEPSDLADVVRESVSIVRGLIEARGLACEMQLPAELPSISLDRKRVRQVLLNLLTNATRFTDRGFIRATVTLQPAGSDGGLEALIAVQDSGRGIPPDKLERAFEAFSQMHESQIRDGSGMGLAVSRQFVALHGGRMWIESQLGAGTTVFFTLPVADTRSAAQLRSQGIELRESEPAVVVLTDHARALDLVRRYVEGYQYVLAETLADAARLLSSFVPAAVVVDRLWTLRHGATLDEIMALTLAPVLQLTLPGTGSMAVQLGVADYLTKPVTREHLLRALERLQHPIHKVLIADNDPHVVRLLSRMVRADFADVQVQETYGGAEALDALRAQPPDVLLLDLLMPDVSGYELLAAMRDSDALRAVPVVIVSARGEEDEDVPVLGSVSFNRRGGYTATQLLQVLGATLQGARALNRVTPLGEAAPASAAPSPETRAG